MAGSEFELTDVINQLRTDLRNAQLEGNKQTPRFLVSEVTVTLAVGVTSEGKAGVNFKVFGVGVDGGASVGSESAQTIQLKLVPRNPDGTEWETAGMSDGVPNGDS